MTILLEQILYIVPHEYYFDDQIFNRFEHGAYRRGDNMVPV